MLCSILLVITIALAGCREITQQEAEDIAGNFMQEHVRFFTHDQNTSINIDSAQRKGVVSYQKEGIWYVTFHIEADHTSGIKSSDLVIGVNPQGEVISLNGKPVSIPS